MPSNKKTFDELLQKECILAPSKMNKDAPCYARLDSLLSTKDELKIYINGNKHLTIAVYSGEFEDKEIVSSAELKEVCRPLAEMLFNWVVPGLEESRKISHSAQVIWEHCKNPGILVASSDTAQIYHRELLEILAVDNEDDAFTAISFVYYLELQWDNRRSPYIFKAYTSVGQRRYREKAVLLFEEKYPGFMQRLSIGVQLGLTPKELAKIAVDTHYEDTIAMPIASYDLLHGV